MSIKSIKMLWIILLTFTMLLSKCYCKLPTSIQTCSRNLPKPDPCIQRAAENVRSLLAKGDLGEGFLTPPLEPLLLETIRMNRGQEFSASFKNLLVNGPSNFVVQHLESNIRNLEFNFTILLPHLNFTGKYALKIRLLLLNIEGKGDVTGFFKNSKAKVQLSGTTTKRNGDDYVTLNKLDVQIQIENAKFNLKNLFRGDKVLTEIGNQFVNENSDLFLAEVIPGLEKSLSKTFLDIANIILKDVTFDEMFPDT